MIRVIKGALALVGLVGVYLLLRWITAGSISGLRTYDLDSLTVLVVGTVAWIAYGWLVLAVVLTALEQIPGAVGALAGAVAGRITTKTARALLRSGLGVAAVTPLTVGAAQAAPGNTAHVQQWTQPSSATQSTNYRAIEPRSTVQLGGQNASYRSTEPGSAAGFGGTDASYRSTEPRSTVELGSTNTSYRFTEPASTVELGNTDSTSQAHTDYRATEPPSQVRLTNPTPSTPNDPTTNTPNRPGTPDRPTTGRTAAGHPTPGRPSAPGAGTAGRVEGGRTASGRPAAPTGSVDSAATPARGQKTGNEMPAGGQKGTNELPPGGRPLVGVPDRPTDGAPTRYTDLRPAVPVRVVVRKGDSLWSIAARELGPRATADAIAARWPDWYATNRHVIGNDPDLILPGQVLRIPPAPTGDHLPPHPQEQ